MSDVAAAHCEAKLHGFRRTADGVVVSFVLHPQDVPQALALDPLGTRYMLAFAAIGDDERPVSPVGPINPKQERTTDGGHGPQPRPQPQPTGGIQRQRYAAMSPAGQAVTRAALLPKDEQFRAWLSAKWFSTENEIIDEETAIRSLRNICCDCNSRKLIAEVPEYLDRFLQMETEYLMDTGQMASPR